jgi:hypothetical protein
VNGHLLDHCRIPGWTDGRRSRSSCSIAAYQVLPYEGANGIRVAAWKHPTRVDGEVFVEYEIQETSAKMAAQKFQTVQARGAADTESLAVTDPSQAARGVSATSQGRPVFHRSL